MTTTVLYGDRSALFTGQLLTNASSHFGDSGAVVVDAENYVVGLLYAGSKTSSLVSPIGPVLQALNVEILI